MPRSPEVRAANQTVATFARILGRPLQLRGNPKDFTDGHVIRVDYGEPDLYLRVEQLLAHVLFRSDAAARNRFVRAIVARAVESATKRGMPSQDFAELTPIVSGIVDVLERRRVSSLWRLIYEGSADQLDRRYHLLVRPVVPNAHLTLMNMLCCLDAGHEIPEGPLDPYRGYLEEALEKVERRGYQATLVVARWLVSKIVSETLNQNPAHAELKGTNKRLAALRETSALLAEVPPELKRFYSNYRPNYRQSESNRSTKTAKAALALDMSDAEAVKRFLEASETLAAKEAAATRNRLHEAIRPRSSDDPLLRGVETSVDLLTVAPTARSKSSVTEQKACDRLRAQLLRVRGGSRIRLDEYGIELDPTAWVERKLSKAALPCFRDGKRSPQFRALILVDRSGSMALGTRNEQAEQACRLLAGAMAFPEVTVEVWGFQSASQGVARILRYEDPRNFDTERYPLGGDTPLHVALELAVNHLKRSGGRRLLLTVTDGEPLFHEKDGTEMPANQIQTAVRTQQLQARRLGISTTTLLIGSTGKNGAVAFDVSPEEVNYMFGARRFRHYVDEHNIETSLVRAVIESFVAAHSG